MRKKQFQILVEVYQYLVDHANYPFSINHIAAQTKFTWRTTKNCIDTLLKLGLIDWGSFRDGKRKYYMANVLKITNQEDDQN